jgi:hypothetical protein
VINVVDGFSYDMALRSHVVSGRHVITVSVHTLLHAFDQVVGQGQGQGQIIEPSEENKKKVDPMMSHDIIESIRSYGYSKITLNFECCSDYGFSLIKKDHCNNSHSHYYFVNEDISKGVIRVIAHMLEYGSQVICSDFAAKALIFNWDREILGVACPFKNIGSTSGSVNVKYDINLCKDCPFPQLAALSSLGIPDDMETTISSCTMSAMPNTIVYGIDPVIDDSLDLRVYSVATNDISDKNISDKNIQNISDMEISESFSLSIPSFNPQPIHEPKILSDPSDSNEHKREYGVRLSHSQSDINGTPVHTVVGFKHHTGILVVSSLHLSNLTDVRTSTEKVIESAALYLGPQRSQELDELLKTLQTPELIRSTTSGIVSEITASANLS